MRRRGQPVTGAAFDRRLTDPQTSGGLLVTVAPDDADAVIGLFNREGFADARAIGRFEAGNAHVEVR